MSVSFEAKYGIVFMRKSRVACIVNHDQIKALQEYRDALDHLMIGMSKGKQNARTRLMAESMRVTRFLNEFEM